MLLFVTEIDISNFEGVYEPAEDSWLMVNHLPKISNTVLEVGCGTGLISIHLSKSGAKVTAVDVNPKAVEATKFNAERNNTIIEVIESNIFDNLSGRKFHTIVCNPPYLPPPSKQYDDDDLALAVEGGPTGSEFTNRFLFDAPTFLEGQGSIFLITTSRMGQIKTTLKSEIIHQEQYFFEKLNLMRFY